MEKNENLVTEKVTENVEQTTEQTPKTYTDEEVNEIVGKRIARNTAKINKKNEREYGELINVLRAGTGKESVAELTDTFKQFYQSKGISVPDKPEYSPRDIEVLAKAEAEDIINSGYDEVVEEVNRLAKIGADNMTDREKAVFKALAEHRQTAERGKELSEIGVTEDIYNSVEFKAFSNKFSAGTPVKEIYEIYAKTQPTKDIKPMGSMKNNTVDNNTVKDYYSYEEAMKYSKEDLDKNPALYKAIVNSMQKWK